MTGILKRNPEKIFYVFLALYTIAGLFNLHILPIVWTDEVMNLDPALQWHKTGQYTGFLWPNKGSDSLFLCYPPLIEFFHIASMYLLPFDIYWMRLPFLLIHAGSLFLLFQILKKITADVPWAAVFFSLLFMFDKVVFEISRSMRVEVLEIFLLLLLLYLHQNGGRFLAKGLVLGLLLTAHLSMWPVAGLWMLLEWRGSAAFRQKMILSICSLFPLLAFFIFIDFRFHDLYLQMFSQAEKHSSAAGIWDKIYGNFIGRFWSVYREQPWVIALFLWMFVSAIRQTIVSRGRAFAPVIFAGTTLVWLFILAPHYRYLPPLLALGFVVLAADPLVSKLLNKRMAVPVTLLLLPLLMAGFVARHIIARWQFPERDPYAVQQWLRTQTDDEKTLILGNAAAFYISSNKSLDYGMDMYPQNLHPERYDKVFFLTADSQNLPLVSVYPVKPKPLPDYMKLFGKGSTYAELKLYRIRDTGDWKMVTVKYEGDYVE